MPTKLSWIEIVCLIRHQPWHMHKAITENESKSLDHITIVPVLYCTLTNPSFQVCVTMARVKLLPGLCGSSEVMATLRQTSALFSFFQTFAQEAKTEERAWVKNHQNRNRAEVAGTSLLERQTLTHKNKKGDVRQIKNQRSPSLVPVSLTVACGKSFCFVALFPSASTSGHCVWVRTGIPHIHRPLI